MEVEEQVVESKVLRGERLPSALTEATAALATEEDLQETAMERPTFAPASISAPGKGKSQFVKVPIPPHRYTPLKQNWLKIYGPVVEHMKLQIRFNTKSRSVEIKTCAATEDHGALQKAMDFVKAFSLGFDVNDALALLRLDDLYIDSFEVEDVRMLKGDHLSRAIGRIAGKDGKTKYTIENTTKTRIVLADNRVHVLGSYANIQVAKDAVVSLILGSPPNKVYAKLRTVANLRSAW